MSDLPESSADPAAPDLADALAYRQAVKRLHEAIDRLPDRERRIIQLQLALSTARSKRQASMASSSISSR